MRKPSGNILALSVSLTATLLLGIAFFVMNYCQLFFVHKEAQAAIDAAALTAARDMSRIVIDENDGCHFGVVALVDDVPRQKDNRPVIGINTLMSTIRLDAIIANQLDNGAMVVLAAHDLERAQADSLLLRRKILSVLNDSRAAFKDKNGQPVSIVDDINKSFDENAVRLAQGRRIGDLKLVAGQVAQFTQAMGAEIGTAAINENTATASTSTSYATNIPVPSPQPYAQVNPGNSMTFNGKTFYKALVDLPVQLTTAGASGILHFSLMPLADAPSLVASGNDSFEEVTDTTPGYLPPYIAKVTGTQAVSPLAPGTAKGKTHKMSVASAAQAGGLLHTFWSDRLRASFPNGIPSQGPDLTSIQSIMNSSKIKLTQIPKSIDAGNSTIIGADQLGTPSSYTNWNPASKGEWLTAEGGAVPGDGTYESSSFRNRVSDDPSTVLSFLVYDWLHAMYLRPNIQQVSNALTTNLGLSNQASRFDFHVIGDAAHDPVNGGAIAFEDAKSQDKATLIEGQLLYQNIAAITVKKPNGNQVWNCIGRDNGANYDGSRSFFANPNDPGFAQSPNLSAPVLMAEWSLVTSEPGINPVQPQPPISPIEPVPTNPPVVTIPSNPPIVPPPGEVPPIEPPITPPPGGNPPSPTVCFTHMGYPHYTERTSPACPPARRYSSKPTDFDQLQVVVDRDLNISYNFPGGSPIHFFTDETSFIKAYDTYFNDKVDLIRTASRGATAPLPPGSYTALSKSTTGSDSLSQYFRNGKGPILKATKFILSPAEIEACKWSFYSQLLYWHEPPPGKCTELQCWQDGGYQAKPPSGWGSGS